MKPHIEEALRSLRAADRDVKAFEALRKLPEIHLSTVCFHAQQAIEKSLKAVLFLRQIEFRPTHDLTELTQLMRLHGIPPPFKDAQLSQMNPFAVKFRYDDAVEDDLISRDAAAELAAQVYQWAGQLVRATAGEFDAASSP